MMQSRSLEPFWGPPPTEWKLGQDEVHVWAAALDQSPERRETLAATLSSEERLKASRFHAPRDRERAISARGLLRQILASYLHCDPKTLAFEYNLNGKPSLAADASARLEPRPTFKTASFSCVKFNLSHSSALFVCAISQSDVGIDVERVGILPEADADAIVERFFTETEKSNYRAAQGGHKERAFYTLWTGKEALAKCSGHGIARERAAEKFEGTMLELTPAAGYIGSLAVQSPSCRLQTWHWPDERE